MPEVPRGIQNFTNSISDTVILDAQSFSSLKQSERAGIHNIIDEADTFEEASKFFLSEDVQRVLGVLKPRERRIVELRYGLGVNEDGKRPDPMSIDAVSKIFDVTKVRIRNLEEKAIKKLKHVATGKQLYEHILPPREKSKLDEIEGRYQADVSRIAGRILAKLTPQSAIDLLEKLRKGSFQNGRLDAVLLGEILNPEEIAKLIESEEQYFRFKPPRVITQDIVLAVNRALQPYHFRKELARSPWVTIKEIKLKEE